MEQNQELVMDQDEREEMAAFWAENQNLFETFGQRLGECALSSDMRRFGWYIQYLEKIIGLAIQVARQAQRGEAQAAHA